MKDKDKLITTGTVLTRHGIEYRVKLKDTQIQILATIAAKFKIPRNKGRGMKKPRIIEGDQVIVEIPPNQTIIERGMIIAFKTD